MRSAYPTAFSTAPTVRLTARGATVAADRADGLARAKARLPVRNLRLLPACFSHLGGPT